MKENDIENYKNLLEQKFKETLDSLNSFKESAAPVDLNEPMGRLSRMDAMQQQQMNLAAKKRLEITKEQIEQALKRLQQDEYGICVSCEEEISTKRLIAQPHTPFCNSCQK
jgi:DnaK suppressor protein